MRRLSRRASVRRAEVAQLSGTDLRIIHQRDGVAEEPVPHLDLRGLQGVGLAGEGTALLVGEEVAGSALEGCPGQEAGDGDGLALSRLADFVRHAVTSTPWIRRGPTSTPYVASQRARRRLRCRQRMWLRWATSAGVRWGRTRGEASDEVLGAALCRPRDGSSSLSSQVRRRAIKCGMSTCFLQVGRAPGPFARSRGSVMCPPWSDPSADPIPRPYRTALHSGTWGTLM